LFVELLVPKAKAVALPVQQLDPVTFAVREHVQCVREGVQSEGLLHHHRESGTILKKFAWTVRKVQYRKNLLGSIAACCTAAYTVALVPPGAPQ